MNIRRVCVGRCASTLVAVMLASGSFFAWAQDDAKPAQPDGQASTTYVGTLKELAKPGAPAPQIAIVIEGKDVTAYACGKDSAFNDTHSRWMKGTIDSDGKFEATGDGQKLSGVLRGDKAEISWTVGGKAMTVEVSRVPEGNKAGLYRTEYTVDEDNCVCGWIVGLDENVSGSILNRRKKRNEAAPDDPAGARVGGLGQKVKAARDVKLVKIAFQRKPNREFQLTFTNFGDTPSQNRAIKLRLLKQDTLNANLGVLQPGETKTISVSIERAKLLRLIGQKLKALGQGAIERLKNRKRLVDVQFEVEVDVGGETVAQTVNVSDETEG